MVSEVSSPVVNEVNVASPKPGRSCRRSSQNKKNTGRIPKKILKAEREKLKRDHLNELFIELGNALADPTRQNNGKASILTDATRLLRNLVAQVQRLRKENVALQSESHYVSVEKTELKDENTVLEKEIEKLQTQLHKRTSSEPAPPSSPPEDHLALPVTDPVVGPLLVIPLHRDFKAYSESQTAQAPPKTPSNVSRPHARYPTPSDSWPSQLLAAQQSDRIEEKQMSDNNSTMMSGREEQGAGSV